MVLHNHVDEKNIRFATMSGTLINNLLGKWLGVIVRGFYQTTSEDSRWIYDQVSDFWTDIDPVSDYSVDG